MMRLADRLQALAPFPSLQLILLSFPAILSFWNLCWISVVTLNKHAKNKLPLEKYCFCIRSLWIRSNKLAPFSDSRIEIYVAVFVLSVVYVQRRKLKARKSWPSTSDLGLRCFQWTNFVERKRSRKKITKGCSLQKVHKLHNGDVVHSFERHLQI